MSITSPLCFFTIGVFMGYQSEATALLIEPPRDSKAFLAAEPAHLRTGGLSRLHHGNNALEKGLAMLRNAAQGVGLDVNVSESFDEKPNATSNIHDSIDQSDFIYTFAEFPKKHSQHVAGTPWSHSLTEGHLETQLHPLRGEFIFLVAIAFLAVAHMSRHAVAATRFGKGHVEPSQVKAEYLGNSEVETFLQCPENRYCADCQAPEAKWASVNLGVFLCIECAGVHRGLGVRISRVQSLEMDDWKEEWIKTCCKVGNRKAAEYYEHGFTGNLRFEHRMSSGNAQPQRPLRRPLSVMDRLFGDSGCLTPHTSISSGNTQNLRQLRERWIRAKYELRAFVPENGVEPCHSIVE